MNRIKISLLLLAFLSFACAYSASPPAALPTPLPSGAVLFQDDFSDPATGWNRLLVGEGVMDYDGGGYRILVNVQEMNFWATPRKEFSNVRIEVDAGKLAGPDENRIGLVCRFNGSDYYFFIMSSDGFYGIGIFSGGQAALLGQGEMLSSTSIQQGLAVNHLRADCVGDQLTFYVNGFQLAQVQDATLTSGDIGLLAGTFATPGVDVVFDNFVVFQP
jgi:hypothetical protein